MDRIYRIDQFSFKKESLFILYPDYPVHPVNVFSVEKNSYPILRLIFFRFAVDFYFNEVSGDSRQRQSRSGEDAEKIARDKRREEDV